MYHSVTFGDRNTWDDWRIVPSSRPVFAPPKQKARTVDLPGADGFLDLSDALTGYPVYENREGSMEFIVMNGYDGYRWHDVYSDIMDYLHGKRMKAILEDDPDYFYEGRFSVNQWASEKDWSRITIDYSVGPYKWETKDSLDASWLWDSFNFNTDYISRSLFGELPVSSGEWREIPLTERTTGRAAFTPSFIVSGTGGAGMDVRLVNHVLGTDRSAHIYDGSTQVYDFIVYGGDATLYFKGDGKVSVSFRKGRL